jgi:RNA exonuclease 1
MGKKRKNRANHYPSTAETEENTMGSTLSTLRPLPVDEVAPFKPINENTIDKTSVSPPPFRAPEEDDAGEWELPGRNKKPKKEKQKQKQNRNYPEFVVSPQRLKRHVSLSDLQTLVLWLSADAPAPQWLLVRVYSSFRHCSTCWMRKTC